MTCCEDFVDHGDEATQQGALECLEELGWLRPNAHSGDRDRSVRAIVITRSGDRDR